MKNSILLIFLCFLGFSFSQNDEEDSLKVSWEWHLVELQNGLKYVGQILSDDGREVFLYTRDIGKVYIKKSEIKSIKKIDDPENMSNGEYMGDDFFSTRYYLTTNAFPLKEGENYVMLNLWGPEIHFGLKKGFTVGVMSSWIMSPMALSLKKSFGTNNKKLGFAAGTILGTSGYINTFRGGGGIYYGNLTYGSKTRNISFSAGLGHYNTGGYNYQPYTKELYIEYNAAQASPLVNGDYTTTRRKTAIGGLFSLSGIAKMNKNMSFVFDAVCSINNKSEFRLNNGTITEDYWDSATGTYVYGTKFVEVKKYDFTRTVLILMPGFRYQKKENRAFQFALAGFIHFYNGNTIAVPVPTCSWMYKL